MWSPQVSLPRFLQRSTLDLNRAPQRRGRRLFAPTPWQLVVALVTFVSLAAVNPRSAFVVFLISSPVWLYLAGLWIAIPNTDPSAHRGFLDDPQGPTPWRLVDPDLSHWGVWRAELGSRAIEVQGRGDRKLVKRFIQKIMDDWSRRSSRGGRVIRIFGELSRLGELFDDDLRSFKIYRLTLQDHLGVRRSGYFWLGEDWAEFLLVPGRHDRDWRKGSSGHVPPSHWPGRERRFTYRRPTRCGIGGLTDNGCRTEEEPCGCRRFPFRTPSGSRRFRRCACSSVVGLIVSRHRGN